MPSALEAIVMSVSARTMLFTVGAAGVLLLSLLAGRAEERPEGKEVANTIGMKLVRIPRGEFLMGGQESAEDLARAFAAYHRKPEYFADEYPRHRVRITRPFSMGKYEVTVGQFRRFVEDSGYKTEAETDGKGGWGYNREIQQCEGRKPEFNWRTPGFAQTDEHPVLNVTWNDAVAFCRWLSKKEGKTYRLPTEAEWEYACRAGTTTRYNNGNDPDALTEVAKVMDGRGKTDFPHVQEVIIPRDKPDAFTRPVGKGKPNAWGLYDMHGNVWEWCQDLYGEKYYSESPVDDPQGPKKRLRVRRGGAWNSWPLWARCSMRNWNTAKSRCVNLGFRVVQEVPTESKEARRDSPPR
jgi:formylglycine-generating enzyme required for sulfatase activity